MYLHIDEENYQNITTYSIGIYSTSNAVMDEEIAEELHLSHEEYKTILINHGAYLRPYTTTSRTYYFLEFKNRNDAEKAIEYLEPWVVMANLTE